MPPDVAGEISLVSEYRTMIETPPSFAQAPVRGAVPPEPDALSEMLRAVRLTGAVFLSARLTAPFGIVSPQRYDERMPMAHLRHISVFHLIASGDCVIETASGDKRQVEAGDLVLLPFANQHRFYKGAATGHGLRPEPHSPGADRRRVDRGLRRRRAGDAAGLRLPRIGRAVHAGVPLAARDAGRACRRGHGRRPAGRPRWGRSPISWRRRLPARRRCSAG